MRSTLFQSFAAKFAAIASHEELRQLYVNDTDIRERIARANLSSITDAIIKHKLTKLRTKYPRTRNDEDVCDNSQRFKVKKILSPSSIDAWCSLMKQPDCEKKGLMKTTPHTPSYYNTDDTDTSDTYTSTNSGSSNVTGEQLRCALNNEDDADAIDDAAICDYDGESDKASDTRGSPTKNTTRRGASGSVRRNIRKSQKYLASQQVNNMTRRKSSRNQRCRNYDAIESACSKNYEILKRLSDKLDSSDSKQRDMKSLVAQLVGIDRSSGKSVPTLLSQIMRILADMQARIVTLSERENRVNVESVFIPNVPGSTPDILPRSCSALKSRVERLLNAKILFEDGEVMAQLRELQCQAANFWREFSGIALRANERVNASKHQPMNDYASASIFNVKQNAYGNTFPGVSQNNLSYCLPSANAAQRIPWKMSETDCAGDGESITSAAAAGQQIKRLTLSLFTTALLETDKALAGGAIKRKHFELGRGTENGPSSRKLIVQLEATEIVIEDEPDWCHVQDDYVEIASVEFDPVSDSGVNAAMQTGNSVSRNLVQSSENLDPNYISNGKIATWSSNTNHCVLQPLRTTEICGRLRVRFNGPKFFSVAADPLWRPVTKFECNDVLLGNAARINYINLSNRHIVILKYLAHTFVHIIAALDTEIQAAGYEHPNTFEFREILRFFEPLSTV